MRGALDSCNTIRATSERTDDDDDDDDIRDQHSGGRKLCRAYEKDMLCKMSHCAVPESLGTQSLCELPSRLEAVTIHEEAAGNVLRKRHNTTLLQQSF